MTAEGTRPGIEADLFESARQRRLTRSPVLIWALLIASVAVSFGSLLQAENADPAQWLEVTMLAAAVAAAVVLISAGTLALHGSRESRWDAPLTVGLGSVLLGIGTFEQVLAASAAVNNAEQSIERMGEAIGIFRWAGLCLIVGGLVWRGQTNWPHRVRLILISFATVAPLAAITGWYESGTDTTVTERTVLLVLAGILLVTSVQQLSHDRSAPLFEGGTVLGTGLALAVTLEVASVAPGDVASVASLLWLVVAGLLTAVWYDRQAALRTQKHRSQTERYLRLIQDGRETLERAISDRSILKHNSTSSLIAIEGGLDALGGSLEGGDAEGHERMTRALAAEIGRLRRMLASVEVEGFEASTRLVDAVDAIVQLARIRGQLLAVDVPHDLTVAARPDAVAEILHNLLDNAAIHAPGALVAIEASEASDGMIALVVHDDGPGVRTDLADRVFEKGVSQRKGTGTGLGLYSARQLAVEAEGDLTLIAADTGAAFKLTLPAAAPAQIIDLRPVTGDNDDNEHDEQVAQ